MHLKELKKKTSAELVEMAEELGVEGASTLRRQDIIFGILKEVAEDGEEIIGQGTIEVLTDGFGFLRNAEANYLAGYHTALARGERKLSGKQLRLLNEVPGIAAALIVIMVVLRPF